MKIVIAGGSGLIGRALCWHFVAAGDEVTVLTRHESTISRIVEGARPVVWDGTSSGAWTRALHGVDVLINLCGAGIGERRWTALRKQEIRESRTGPGKALAEALCRAEVPPVLLVQASGVGFYGPSRDSRFDESSHVGADWLASVAMDWEASSVAVPPVTRRFVARFGVVLSPEGGVLPRMLPPFRWFVGGPLGNGEQWFPWIHIDDLVSAIEYLAFETDVTGPVNVVAPEAATNRDFVRAIGRALHRPARIPVPRVVIAATLGEMSTIVLDGQHVRPRVLEENGFIFNFPGVELALHDLLRR